MLASFAVRRTTTVLPALLVLGLVFCLSGALLNGWGAFYFGAADSDLTNQFYPWRVFLHRWLERGVFPFWDPHVFSGYPVLETQQMLALNPVHVLTTWLPPPRIGLLLDAALHVCIAVLCTWAALRSLLRCSRSGAALGVICYVTGAVFAMRIGAGHFTVVAAMAWWPLAVAATARLSRSAFPPQRRSLRAVVRACTAGQFHGEAAGIFLLVVLANSMVVLAGAPQYIVYLFWIELVVVLLSARWWPAALCRLATAWMLAMLLSAPQWLPMLWYLPYTGRASGGLMTRVSPLELQLLFMETLFRFPLGDDLKKPHMYTKAVWEVCLYPGVAALAITLSFFTISLARIFRSFQWPEVVRRKRWPELSDLFYLERRLPFSRFKMLIGGGIFVLGLYLVAGNWLPGFSSFREPLKARAILALGFAFIAAFGFDLLVRARNTNKLFLLPGAWALALLLSAVFVYQKGGNVEWFLNYVGQFAPSIDPAANRFMSAVRETPSLGTSILTGSAVHTGIFAVVVLIISLLSSNRRSVAHALVLVAFVDLLFAHLLAFQSRNRYGDETGLAAPLQQQFREALKPVYLAEEVPWRVTLPSWTINRSHLVEGLYETGGYDPMMPASANNRILLTPKAQGAPGPRIALVHQAVGRRYDCREAKPSDLLLQASEPCPRVSSVAQLVDIERKLTVAYPRLFFGPKEDHTNFVADAAKPQSESDTAVPQWVREQVRGINPLQEGPVSGHGIAAGEALKVNQQKTPNSLSASVLLKAPGLLVYRTTWLPGWTVSIDGGPAVKPLCANGWMLATPLPAGKHHVEFRYRPVALGTAVIMSSLGCVAFLALLGIVIRRRQRPIPDSHPLDRRPDIEKAHVAPA